MKKSSKLNRRRYNRPRKSGVNKKHAEKLVAQVINANSGWFTQLKARPLGPRLGAQYSTRQMVTTFQVSSGLTSSNNIQAGLTNTFGSVAVTLGDLPEASALASVFDQYRMDEFEVWIKPRANSFASNTAGFLPTLTAVVDRDDSTTPTSMSYLQQYDNVVHAEVSEGTLFRFTPSATPSIYASGAFSGYAIEENLWIDSTNNDVPFYGIKFGVSATAITNPTQFTWEVIVFAFLSFKNTH